VDVIFNRRLSLTLKVGLIPLNLRLRAA